MRKEELVSILGSLAPLYLDPEVTDILVDAPDRIYLVRSDRAGGIADLGVKFDTPEAIRQIVDSVMALGGVRLSAENSTGEVRLPDGSRAVGVIPPTATDSPYLVIRKPDPSKSSFTWEMLLSWGTLSPQAHEVLMKAIHLWVNLLVVGSTRNAKDWLVNLLAESITPEERVIVVADSFVLPVSKHPRRIHLEPAAPGKASTGKLLEVASKMRPNWLVVGELAGAEAMQVVQLMNSNHPTLTSLCADSPLDALAQIESMCLMGNPGLGLGEIRQMIASAFGLICFLNTYTLPDYRIKVTEMVELAGVENDRYVLKPLFTYDVEHGILNQTEVGKGWVERMRGRLTKG